MGNWFGILIIDSLGVSYLVQQRHVNHSNTVHVTY